MVPLKDLALAALTSPNGACYIQKGGILTPPAYGTLGNATPRHVHRAQISRMWTWRCEKMWQFKERYTAQLRIECYNVFNHVNFAPFADGTSDPSQGGGVVTNGGTFGFATSGRRERRVQ